MTRKRIMIAVIAGGAPGNVRRIVSAVNREKNVTMRLAAKPMIAASHNTMKTSPLMTNRNDLMMASAIFAVAHTMSQFAQSELLGLVSWVVALNRIESISTGPLFGYRPEHMLPEPQSCRAKRRAGKASGGPVGPWNSSDQNRPDIESVGPVTFETVLLTEKEP